MFDDTRLAASKPTQPASSPKSLWGDGLVQPEAGSDHSEHSLGADKREAFAYAPPKNTCEPYSEIRHAVEPNTSRPSERHHSWAEAAKELWNSGELARIAKKLARGEEFLSEVLPQEMWAAVYDPRPKKRRDAKQPKEWNTLAWYSKHAEDAGRDFCKRWWRMRAEDKEPRDFEWWGWRRDCPKDKAPVWHAPPPAERAIVDPTPAEFEDALAEARKKFLRASSPVVAVSEGLLDGARTIILFLPPLDIQAQESLPGVFHGIPALILLTNDAKIAGLANQVRLALPDFVGHADACRQLARFMGATEAQAREVLEREAGKLIEVVYDPPDDPKGRRYFRAAYRFPLKIEVPTHA